MAKGETLEAPQERRAQALAVELAELAKTMPPDKFQIEVAWRLAAAEAGREAAESSVSKSEKKVEVLTAQNEALEKRVVELSYDSLTGLGNRARYFTEVDRRIEELIQEETLDKLLAKDTLTASDKKKLEKLTFSVTQIDIGYLSKYNEDPRLKLPKGVEAEGFGEHAIGDYLLRNSAEIIQKRDSATSVPRSTLHKEVEGYRLGGDEFALIQELPKEKAKEVAFEYQLKHGQIKLEGADIPPVVDVGTAHLSEAVEAFMEAYDTEARKAMSPEDQAKTIQKLLTAIADRRTKVSKGLNRIIQMIDLYERDPQAFGNNFVWMTKGAFRLKREWFEEQVRAKASAPESFQRTIHDLVRLELDKDEEKEVDVREVVRKIADREFLR